MTCISRPISAEFSGRSRVTSAARASKDSAYDLVLLLIFGVDRICQSYQRRDTLLIRQGIDRSFRFRKLAGIDQVIAILHIKVSKQLTTRVAFKIFRQNISRGLGVAAVEEPARCGLVNIPPVVD